MTGSLAAVGLTGGPIGALATASDPPQLLPAREQMAFTLGFHIVLVPFGVTFTILMLIANYLGLRLCGSPSNSRAAVRRSHHPPRQLCQNRRPPLPRRPVRPRPPR